jgi:hypothetical protein
LAGMWNPFVFRLSKAASSDGFPIELGRRLWIRSSQMAAIALNRAGPTRIAQRVLLCRPEIRSDVTTGLFEK